MSGGWLDPPTTETVLNSASKPGMQVVLDDEVVVAKFNQVLKAQAIDKTYRKSNWFPDDWKPCQKTTSAVKIVVESFGFSPDDWVAEVKRDKKGMVVWRFHWGTPNSYLDTKARFTRCVAKMVQLGRLLTRDELREINIGGKYQDGPKKRSIEKTPNTGKRSRASESKAQPSIHGEQVMVYDSDGDSGEDRSISSRKIGSQMVKYHVDRGPRPDREQLQVMRSEFLKKKVLLTATITRLGMSDGCLCADLKIGEQHLRTQKWLGLEGCMQMLDAAAPATVALAGQQEVVCQLRQNLAEAERARDAALEAQEIANRAVDSLTSSLQEAQENAATFASSQEPQALQALRLENTRLKAIEEKFEQFKAFFGK